MLQFQQEITLFQSNFQQNNSRMNGSQISNSENSCDDTFFGQNEINFVACDDPVSSNASNEKSEVTFSTFLFEKEPDFNQLDQNSLLHDLSPIIPSQSSFPSFTKTNLLNKTRLFESFEDSLSHIPMENDVLATSCGHFSLDSIVSVNEKQIKSINESNELSTDFSIEFEENNEIKELDNNYLSSLKEGKLLLLEEDFPHESNNC